VKGFSTQKLTWGSSASGGGWDSVEKTPEGTPFNVGIWVGPDGQNVLAALNPGSYSGGIYTDLSKDLPADKPSEALADLKKKAGDLEKKLEQEQEKKQPFDDKELQEYFALRGDQNALVRLQQDRSHEKYQGDWAARAMGNGNSTGLFTDYHYYCTGDIGGAPDEESVKRLEAIVTKGVVDMPLPNGLYFDQNHPKWPEIKVGQGPVQVISATADQMFLNITPQEDMKLPRYTGTLELTNHLQ
jgi:alpha-mannosidase